MASCMLCSSSVADDESVCPYCGGATDARPGHGSSAVDPTQVQAAPPWAEPTTVGPPPSSDWSANSPWGPPPGSQGAAWGEPVPGAWRPPPGPPSYGMPAGYGGPSYGVPTGYGPPSGFAPPPLAWSPPPPTNGMAVTAFVISLIALITAGFCGITILGSPVAAVMGHMSLRRIATTGEQGRGLALAAAILGWIGTSLLVIGIAVLIGLVAAA